LLESLKTDFRTGVLRMLSCAYDRNALRGISTALVAFPQLPRGRHRSQWLQESVHCGIPSQLSALYNNKGRKDQAHEWTIRRRTRSERFPILIDQNPRIALFFQLFTNYNCLFHHIFLSHTLNSSRAHIALHPWNTPVMLFSTS
jgi:hypothetical protein